VFKILIWSNDMLSDVSRGFMNLYIYLRMKRFNGYQPLPWVGLTSKIRDQSSYERLSLIEKYIEDNKETKSFRSALDIGCNVGFFVYSFAMKGMVALGLDRSEKAISFTSLIRSKLNIKGAAFTCIELNPDNIDTIPKTDIVVLFSAWHHWVKQFGLNEGNLMLSTVWDRTGEALFFEGGEDTEIENFKIKEDPQKWIKEQLASVCAGGEVVVLGRVSAGEHLGGSHNRTIFAVTRKNA